MTLRKEQVLARDFEIKTGYVFSEIMKRQEYENTKQYTEFFFSEKCLFTSNFLFIIQNHLLRSCFPAQSQNVQTLPDFIPWGSGYESVYYGIWDSTPT